MPDSDNTKTDIMTLQDAAERIGISRAKLYNEWKAGKIEFGRLGKTRYVTVAEVVRYLEEEKLVVQKKIDSVTKMAS